MRRIFALSATALVFLALAGYAGGAEFHVLHAEPVSAKASELPSSPGPARLSFQAYGRQFELQLQPNARLLAHLPATQKATLQKFPIYRGELVGVPGSWVRLTRIGETLQGAFWDGTDLYTLAPAQDVAPFALQSIDASGTETVVYRLTDTQSALDTAFCASGPEHDVSGKTRAGSAAATSYEKLIGELRAQAVTAAVATEQIEVAFVADFEFDSRFSPGTQSTMLTRINVIDGIFGGQVGVSIVPSFQIFTENNDPFTSTNASTLLNELTTYRRNTPAIRNRGIAHLMTGKGLDGNTAGIAFIGVLCSVNNGGGLSEGTGSNTVASLIAAHEIGHNFGAPHDAEAGSVCESAPATFLMNPQINGSSTFSQCSLDQIRPEVTAATCVTAIPTGDVALGVLSGTLSAQIETNFNVLIDVNSVGAAQVSGVSVTATPSASLTISSASASSGTCTVGANSVVTCDLGAMASAATRQITLVTRGTATGSAQVNVTLAASNDSNTTNNSGSQAVSISAPPAPPPPPPPPSGGGGGGGALSTWFVVLMLGLLSLRVMRTQRARARA